VVFTEYWPEKENMNTKKIDGIDEQDLQVFKKTI
jgi:hypothetical protein